MISFQNVNILLDCSSRSGSMLKCVHSSVGYNMTLLMPIKQKNEIFYYTHSWTSICELRIPWHVKEVKCQVYQIWHSLQQKNITYSYKWANHKKGKEGGNLKCQISKRKFRVSYRLKEQKLKQERRVLRRDQLCSRVLWYKASSHQFIISV